MNRLRSRPVSVASVAVIALLLSLAAPSLLSALGSLSGPVGCQSSVGPDLSDDLTDDFPDDVSDDFTDDFSGDLSGDLSDDPCILVPDSPNAEGDDDSGGAERGRRRRRGRGGVADVHRLKPVSTPATLVPMASTA